MEEGVNSGGKWSSEEGSDWAVIANGGQRYGLLAIAANMSGGKNDEESSIISRNKMARGACPWLV